MNKIVYYTNLTLMILATCLFIIISTQFPKALLLNTMLQLAFVLLIIGYYYLKKKNYINQDKLFYDYALLSLNIYSIFIASRTVLDPEINFMNYVNQNYHFFNYLFLMPLIIIMLTNFLLIVINKKLFNK